MLTGNNRSLAEYDCVISIKSDDTPRIQEAHIFIGHVIAENVEKDLAEKEE